MFLYNSVTSYADQLNSNKFSFYKQYKDQVYNTLENNNKLKDNDISVSDIVVQSH